MPKYRYVGTVASEVAIGETIVPIGPGDFVTMSAEEAEETELALLEVDEKATAKTATTDVAEGGEKT